MAKNEEFYKLKSILSQIPGSNVQPKHGGSFRFPIYMTDSLANTPIDALELSVRSNNCLRRADIDTIGCLCDRVQNSRDLKTIRNCGSTSVAEIMDNLFAYQYSILSEERKAQFLIRVFEMNLKRI